MKKLLNSWILSWVVLAVGSTVGALLFGPWLIPPLDAKEEQFHGMIEAGIMLLRWDLAAGVVLALLSLALWRRGENVSQGPQAEPSRESVAGTGALILMVIVVALTAPRLDAALWWDELRTLTRVVKRGPAVIFTFSSNANNHVLNSLLMWASLHAIGEHETVLRLSPFLFCLAAVQLLYWTLLRAGGPGVAFLVGLAAATHPWLINHGVEARGYAGAILFSWTAIVSFARLITQGSPRWTVLYIASCVTAFGFMTTTILIPIAHGAVACFLLLAGYCRPALASYRANAVNLIFACLWVPVLAVLLFGLPLPQTLAYAQNGATKEHLPLGWPLGEEVLTYLTGMGVTVPAVLLAGVAFLGWCSGLRRGSPRSLRLLMLSSLVPLGAVLLYMLVPGSHSSARFFCFLILPVCWGMGMGVIWLLRMRPVGLIAAGLVVAGWLGTWALEHKRLLGNANPDLKALAAELQGKRTVLVGAQAYLNTYYFGQAIIYEEGKSQATLQEAIAGAEIVVEGRARRDNFLDKPDATLLAQGFRVYQTLPTALKGLTQKLHDIQRVEYLVYRRVVRAEGAGGKRGHSETDN
jgi:hypothetical protein